MYAHVRDPTPLSTRRRCGKRECAACVLALLSSAILGSADFIGGENRQTGALDCGRRLVQCRRSARAIVIVALLPGRFTTADLACGLVAGLCGSAGAVLLYKRWPSAPCRSWPGHRCRGCACSRFAGLMQGSGRQPLALGLPSPSRHAADLPTSQASPASNGRMRGIGRALLAGVAFPGWPCLLALHRRQRGGRWSLHAARRCPCSLVLLVLGPPRMPPGSLGWHCCPASST